MNSASSLAAAVVVARLELLQADEVFGVDDRLLHGAPAFMGRMAGEVFAPHGEGLRVFLLPVIDLAQRPAGLGQFFAIFPARVLQEVLERGHGLVVVAQVELTLGDLQMGRSGQFVRGEAVEKSSRAATPRRRSSSLPGWGQCHVSAKWKAASAGQSCGRHAGTLRVPSAWWCAVRHGCERLPVPSSAVPARPCGLPAACRRPGGIRPAGSGLPCCRGSSAMCREEFFIGLGRLRPAWPSFCKQ